MSVRVYGTQCTLCERILLRGAGDADVCARCESDIEWVER